MPKRLKRVIEDRARRHGFDVCRFTTPEAIVSEAQRLLDYVERGYHGDMAWMAETLERRANPAALWPDCRSVIMLGVNYGQPESGDPLAALADRQRGVIARYAKGRDYHEVIKGRLKQVAAALAAEPGIEIKVFVDTAPLMEKPLAAAAGIGWQGKHTNLVSREFGSWLFLGAILTTAELAPDEPETDHCGACRRCLDICPTAAFPAPYRLDARRCISYLTIEHAGHIALEFRAAIGNRIFGCDDCLAVCPWNKFAQTSREVQFAARAETDAPPLDNLLALDAAAFRIRFRGTPIRRTGRDRFLRNVLIAAGNSGDGSLLASVRHLLDDASPVVRAMAVWALSRLAGREEFAAQCARRLANERDAAVAREWQADDNDEA